MGRFGEEWGKMSGGKWGIVEVRRFEWLVMIFWRTKRIIGDKLRLNLGDLIVK